MLSFSTGLVGELSSRLGELDNIRRFLTGTALTVVLDSLFSLLYLALCIFIAQSLLLLLSHSIFSISNCWDYPYNPKLIQKELASAKTQSLMVELLSGIQTIKLQSSEIDSRKDGKRHLKTINQDLMQS